MRRITLAASLGLLIACGSTTQTAPPTATTVIAPELGRDGKAQLLELIDSSTGLKRPRDLAFNPRTPDQLWIVNDLDNSVVIVHGTTSASTQYERRRDPAADHFMHKPSAIAFGADETTFGTPGTFATCGESRNEHGVAAAGDFMGPALWSSDLTIFAVKDPIGLGSHLDMLHNSPLCMGIAHEQGNVYWTTNGRDNAINRYDFAADHDIGLDDHSDGASLEFVTGQIKYAPGVPSHMFYRAADAMLYFADTGNGRVVKLDTQSGTRGAKLPTKEPQRGGHYRMDDAVLTEVVPPGVLTAPSGLEIHNDLLYVSDNGTGRIVAFDLTGKEVNAFDTGLGQGALAGIAFGPDGRLYLVDMLGNRVLYIEPSP
jgi:hypothetical protein